MLGGRSGHRVARCSIADLGKHESKAGTPRGGPRAAREPYSGIDVGFMAFWHWTTRMRGSLTVRLGEPGELEPRVQLWLKACKGPGTAAVRIAPGTART